MKRQPKAIYIATILSLLTIKPAWCEITERRGIQALEETSRDSPSSTVRGNLKSAILQGDTGSPNLALELTPTQNQSNFATCEAVITRSVSTKNISKSPDQTTINSQNNSAEDVARGSFWWATEQFDPFGGRLVENWLTYPNVQQINLIVNWQLWTLLDYLDRYRFVNQFGTVARKYGYNLNIVNRRQQCLATYQYNSVANPPKWEIKLEKLGKDSLQIEPQ